MPSYMIRFKDGSFHHKQGIGDFTTNRNDAALYYSLDDAKRMVWELQEVDAIISSSFRGEVVVQY